MERLTRGTHREPALTPNIVGIRIMVEVELKKGIFE
jgi:hypothetical protein